RRQASPTRGHRHSRRMRKAFRNCGRNGMNPVRSFLVAVSFLTIVPVKAGVVGSAELSRSLAFFPLVGLLLGVVLAGMAWLIPPGATAGLVGVGLTALLAVLTGGFHLDGLADVFDGLGGGRGDRERMLAIMKDSRIGAHGAAALVLVLMGKAFALVGLWQSGAFEVLLSFP